MSKVLYEVELLPSGKVEVVWKSAEGKLFSKVMHPDDLEEGVREFVKFFIEEE